VEIRGRVHAPLQRVEIARWESEVGGYDAILFFGRGESVFVGLCAGNGRGFLAPGNGCAGEIGSMNTNIFVNGECADGPGAFSGARMRCSVAFVAQK
jgi:hypothetical protein